MNVTARTLAVALIAASLLPTVAEAQRRGDRERPARNEARTGRPAPQTQGSAANRPQEQRPRPEVLETDIRSIDGSGNNPGAPEIGATHIQLIRLGHADYADGVSELAGEVRPSARAISNALCDQSAPIYSRRNATDFLWQWGQFLDHDIDLTDTGDPVEPADIPVPLGDPFFDPFGTGTATIALNRSIYDFGTGTDVTNPREQTNEITAWIDASNVYGSDSARAAALRTLDGTGRLKTSAGNLLPFNENGLDNAGGPSASLFLAGDVRANEQVGLISMHTLFVREHNRLADSIARFRPTLTGDQIYEMARRIVGAQMQVITYREFLPILLGPDALAPYQGYRPDVDASIANEFSSAAYRLGHSLLNETVLRLDADGNEIPQGHLALRDAFFSPSRITDEGGIEPVLRGLAAQKCQELDPYLVDDVRNFLFGPPGAGGFDLASLNIQRGRDHGLPSYNDMRIAMGMRPATGFADISSDADIQAKLASAYDEVDDVDLWVGGLAEDHRRGAMVGELYYRILKHQFEALRDGDRFWYTRVLSPLDRIVVESTLLSDIIRRNTDIGGELSSNVFITRGQRP